jgi:hypothetical protein
MQKVPIAPTSAKKVIEGQRSGKWVFRIFIIKIYQTKIVEHAILYKKCTYTFFPKNNHIAIPKAEKVVLNCLKNKTQRPIS